MKQKKPGISQDSNHDKVSLLLKGNEYKRNKSESQNQTKTENIKVIFLTYYLFIYL